MELSDLPMVYVGLFTQPVTLFEQSQRDEGYRFSLLFALLMTVLSSLLAVLVGGDAMVSAQAGTGVVGAVLGGLFFGPIVVLFLALMVHVVSRLAGGSGAFQRSFQIAAFSLAPAPLASLLGRFELLAVLPSIYSLVLVWLGISVLHEASRARTAAALGGVVVLLAAAGAGLGYVFFKGLTSSRPPLAVAMPPPPAVVQVTPQPSSPPPSAPEAPPAEPPAAAPVRLTVSLSSAPPGATVVRISDQKVLGVTPMLWKAESGGPPVPLRFSLAGYQDVTREVNADQEFKVLVPLQPLTR